MPMVPRRPRPGILEQDLGYNCYRIEQLLREAQLQHLRRIDPDLTPEQWHLLLCMWQVPEGLTPSDLAQVSQRDKTTISRMLDVMERHDLIERVRREADNRSYFVRLASKSQQLLEAAQREAGIFGAQSIFAPLSNAEQELLLALLQKCRRGIGDL